MHYEYLSKKGVFDGADLEQKVIEDANFTNQNSGGDRRSMNNYRACPMKSHFLLTELM